MCWRILTVDLPAAALIALGLLLGSYAGARLGLSLPPEFMQRAFGILLVGVGLRFALFG